VTEMLNEDDVVEMNGETGEIFLIEMKILTGLCVCPGIVKGRLVRYEERRQYTKEDIVVLNEYVTQNILLLKNVGAILSSTGGITCHASLIAREFNIPCLVSIHGLDEVKENTKITVDAAAEEVIVDGNNSD
ncbi:MAG: PEP-utilizing enzyme, partial [Nanoarchaeota archaeon]